MSKDFAILKQKWTDQAMADSELPRAAVVVVYRLAFGHLNAKTGVCHPGQDTLAAAVGVSERQLRNLLAVLVARGHLEVIRVGKKATNRYRPIINDRKSASAHKGDSDRKSTSDHEDDDRQSIADHEEPLTGNLASVDRQSISSVTGNVLPVHSNFLSEPLEEPHYPDPLRGSGGDNNLSSVFEDTSIENLNTEARAPERAASVRPDEETDPVGHTFEEDQDIEISGYDGKFTVLWVFPDRIIVRSWITGDTIMFSLNENGSIDHASGRITDKPIEYDRAITG